MNSQFKIDIIEYFIFTKVIVQYSRKLLIAPGSEDWKIFSLVNKKKCAKSKT